MKTEPCTLLKSNPSITPEWQKKGKVASKQLRAILSQTQIAPTDSNEYPLRVLPPGPRDFGSLASLRQCELLAVGINDDETVSFVIDATASDEANSPYFKVTFARPKPRRRWSTWIAVKIQQYKL